MATAQPHPRIRVIFHGRVQGVGFRATTATLARDFAVTGFVQNEPDGTVYFEAQGAPDEIERLLTRIRAVFRTQITQEQHAAAPPVPNEARFEIRY